MMLLPPENIVYCYGEYQPIFNNYPNVTFSEELSHFNQFDGKQSTLLIINDLVSKKNDTV
jgi:hypothetical protein